mgnify:FL=1
MSKKHNLLSEIIQNRKDDVRSISSFETREFKQIINEIPGAHDFLGAVSRTDKFCVIAEIKKSSPSTGILRNDFNVIEFANLYQNCGAAAISVLTDQRYFGGSISDLIEVRKNTQLPILRKDFIVDEKQIFESRAYGADAILLIAAALDDVQMAEFYQLSCELGMASIIETHSFEEIDRAIRLDPPIIGINNRCLKTLHVDLSVSETLKKFVPPTVCVISESGIRTRSDAERLSKIGINAFLIGTSIIKAQDSGKALRQFTEK